jgi:hypothetical protein
MDQFLNLVSIACSGAAVLAAIVSGLNIMAEDRSKEERYHAGFMSMTACATLFGLALVLHLTSFHTP